MPDFRPCFTPWVVILIAGCQPAALTSVQDLAVVDFLPPDPGGRCISDKVCYSVPGATRCNPVNHICTECLPGPTDNCPAGMVCIPLGDDYHCVPRCHTDADCAARSDGAPCCDGTTCHDPRTDVGNCGACGRTCPDLPNAAVACVAGNCVIGTCNAGYADCDRLSVSGCETNTDVNPKNCGTCGTVCASVINGAGTCKAGACSTACKAGFADCNKNLADGCEVALDVDARNCGACGTICPNAMKTCLNGVCLP